ncbi:hypothetical protein [Acidaminococcus intestini]|uniref:hypothetical protein n=1 Tax=Acidaminococcus intestini TaxID=187327 RepID=UPI0002D9EE9A|nr:hypothetical protein [Acidaminococcus intestini]UWN56054.1 hypothetical protein NQ562_05225 [Acidaminococcus intestini]
MALIKACYPKFTDVQGEAYAQLTADIPEGVLAQAVKNVIKTSRYQPTVAEIRDEAARIVKAATGTRAPMAEEEWEKVLRAVGSVGPYRIPVMKDKEPLAANEAPVWENCLTESAVKKIGWITLCGTETASMGYLRGQFIATWEKLAAREKAQRRMKNTLRGQTGRQIVANLAKKLGAGQEPKRLEGGQNADGGNKGQTALRPAAV